MAATRRSGAAPLRRHTLRLHGQEISYLRAGDGPALLLVHGIAGNAEVWRPMIPALAAAGHTVVALDLLGHGRSSKPAGDYSLGSQACVIRDLMVALDIPSATVVGHSLGGGITMQFAYQFPERCERMVLVASGGLGAEVTLLLRSLGLPGADLVAPLVLSRWAADRMLSAARLAGRLGFSATPGRQVLWESFSGLTDPETRRAFVATVHAVIDRNGQRVSAVERLYLAEQLPVLILWGERDRIIPVSHAHAAHEAMPHSRMHVIPEAGHFLQVERPHEVARIILDFIRSTRPGTSDPRALVRRLRRGSGGLAPAS